MNSSYLIGIIRWLTYAVLATVPLFYIKESVYPYIVSKTLFFQILVELLFATWCLLMATDRKYRPRYTPAFWGLLIFFGALFITTILGVDVHRSFWSLQDRMIGVFAFLHLAAFGLVVASMREIFEEKKLFFISLGTAALLVFIAVLQLENPSLLLNEPINNRPGATFGNPSFLAGYLVFHIIWLFYFILKSHKQSLERWVLISAQAWLVLGLLITQTRGNLIGLIVGLMSLVALFAVWPPVEKGFFSKRKSYIIFLILFVCGVGLFFTTRSSTVWDPIPGIQRFRNISLEGDEFGPRIIALGSAWKGFVERPVFGWGWENFNVVFNKYYEPSTLRFGYIETRFDKPHNYLAEFLVVGGAVLLFSYFIFLGSLLYIIWRSGDRLWAQVVTATLIGHMFGAIFIFETLGSLMIFYLIFGLGTSRYLNHQKQILEKQGKKVVQEKTSGKNPLFYAAAIVAVIPIFWVNIPTMRASHYQFLGFTTFKNSSTLGMANFKTAISIGGPYLWNLERDYAAAISEAYFYNPELIPPEVVTEALERVERVAKEHPLDAYHYYALVDMYNQTSDVDKIGHVKKAEIAGARALELSPNRQQVLFSLAKTKSLEGDVQGAVALAKKALDLDTKIADAHFYYGLLLYVSDDPEQGYKSLKEAIALGRKWKNVNESLTVAGFFADSGHLDDAITIYEEARGMAPAAVELRLRLGVAYFLDGRREDAKKMLSSVLGEVDIKTSPRYNELLPILRNLGIE